MSRRSRRSTRRRPSGKRSPRPTLKIMSFMAAWPIATWRLASRKRARRPPGGDDVVRPGAGHPRAARGAASRSGPLPATSGGLLLGNRDHRGEAPVRRSRSGKPRESTSDPAGVDRPISGERSSYRQRLAEIINVLGFVYSKRLDNADAIRCFEEVQEICQSLLDQVTAGPKPVKLLDLLALSHYNIATIHYGERPV